ncbi:MAG: ferrous iron transport protein B [Candidatus Krumholzibacteriota bacterium]|nr:ferrous iron transport protein B [Candidatus Krumholzibacteriota bacterium]
MFERLRTGGGVPQELYQSRELTVALAGNPNSGKTSVFNGLTGGHQHVGNYPGVTVEKKWGRVRGLGGPMLVVDLPGTYGLTTRSDEERVARGFLLRDRPDVVTDVIDASNLERNLHLAVQLLELELNLVLALNMSDMARDQGQRLDLERLGELMDAPVVETVASRGGGLDALKQAMREAATRTRGERRVDYGEDLEAEIVRVEAALAPAPDLVFPRRYAAVKLLEGDSEVQAELSRVHPDFAAVQAVVQAARARLQLRFREDTAVLIADRRYGFAAGLAREVTLRGPRLDRVTRSEHIDGVLAHRWLGLPIFALFMFLLFWITFRAGAPLMDLMENGFGRLAAGVDAVWPAGRLAALHSLLLDGVIGGVGGVLVFLPNIVLLFLGISVLEETGYMARGAFIMDRLMHHFGLHGKSFIPMLVGFGCTVPAIMATRMLPSRRDRIVTILILPFISCGARLPVYLLIIPAFFPPLWQAPLLLGIYLLGTCLGLVVARILSRTVLVGEETPFVMELPPYRLPTARSVLFHMWHRAWLYVRKAGTVILFISVILWLLTSYPKPELSQVAGGAARAGQTIAQTAAARQAEALEYSTAGRIGKALAPAMAPLGFDWRITTAFLGAFAAKEVFVAQMGIVFSLGEEGAGGNRRLRETLAANYTPRTGLSILIFALLATPCMVTFVVTGREAGGWRWAVAQWVGFTALAWLVAFVVYQVTGLVMA